MLNADFPLYTKQCLRNEMEKIKKTLPAAAIEPVEKVRKKLREEPIVIKQESTESLEDKLAALKNKCK